MKKRIGKICSVAFVLLLAFLVGCGDEASNSDSSSEVSEVSDTEDASSSSTSDSGYKIGLSMPSFQMERNLRENEIIQELCDEAGIELISQGADDDSNKQLTQCENMLSAGVDVLIVYPVDSSASAKIVELAAEVDVPVIAYDNMINDCDLDFYVSFDSREVGRLIAEYMIERVPEGNYLLLEGEPTSNNAQLVYNGFYDVLQEYIDSGDIIIVADQWCENWGTEQAMQHTENALTSSNNDIDCILTAYDGMATGAIAALDAQGLAGSVLVGGQDAEVSACQRIVEGTQAMTIYKPTDQIAVNAFELARMLVTGEDYSSLINGSVENGYKDVEAILPDIYVVTAENMVETMIEPGYRELEDVYANIPEDEWPEIG